MCDIYTADCAGGCGCKMEMHIGDFSVGREHVHPYCPRCTRKEAKEDKYIRLFLKGAENSGKGGVQVFGEKKEKWYSYVLTCDGPLLVDGGKKGDVGFIRCTSLQGYDIGLNDGG